MSSSAAASSYWRVAGMTYLKYSNLCADMVRASLKDGLRAKAKTREAIYYRAALWENGKPAKQCAGLPHVAEHLPCIFTMPVLCLLLKAVCLSCLLHLSAVAVAAPCWLRELYKWCTATVV